MEIKAKDMCPRCKYCLGMTPQGMYSCGKANDGSELNIGINVVLNCANFELEDEVLIRDEKKAKDEEIEKLRLTLGEKNEDLHKLSDNYDELLDKHGKLKCKLLDMLQKKEELEARNTELIKASKRKDDLIQDYREKLKKANDEINLLNSKLDKLGEYYRTDEKLINNIQKVIFPQEEGSDYTYSYDEILKKVKELKEDLEKANKLTDSWKRDYERIRELFLCPIYNILYPDNPNLDINVTALLDDVKNLKIYAGENKSIQEDLKYWMERCHKAETDVTTLNSKVEVLKNKSDKYLNKIVTQRSTHYKQCARILELENMVNKLQSGEYDDILAKDIEIKSLQAKYEDAMAGWKDAIDTNDKQFEELTRRYNMIAKKLNDIHDILKEESDNE